VVASQLTLCSLHHTLAHEGRFGVRVTDDGVFVFTRPDGKSLRPSGSGREASEHDERFRGIVASAPPIGDAGLDAFEATIRSHILQLSRSQPQDRRTHEPLQMARRAHGLQHRYQRLGCHPEPL